MKHIYWFFLLFIGISITVSAQNIVKDTIAKDSTASLTLGKIVKLIIKDTVPKTDAEEDTLLERKFEGKAYSLNQFTHETYLYVKEPARWHTSDWLRLGLVFVTTAAIIPFDQRIANATQNNQHTYYDLPVEAGRIYGEWYFTASVGAVFVGYGILRHNIKAEKIDIELFQAGIYSELITQALKVGIGRASPYEKMGIFSFRPFKFEKGFGSMPNGSATDAFALSTITSRHAESTFLKVLAYVPAAFNLFSGVYKDSHWASDEFIGAVIGYATGMWVVNLHEGRRHKINIPHNEN
jgi:hypothetical protein